MTFKRKFSHSMRRPGVCLILLLPYSPDNSMARAHRIGQTRAVRVYRLLTAKTYEMHMFHSASMKLGLERAVLSQQRDPGEEGEGKSKKSDREAQAKEIDFLLKKGAYDVFKEDDDEEAQKFMETDIDQLLESNAQTVTYGKNEESAASGGLGSFSKASFVTDTGDGEKDVDLDDPDFWKKAAGLEAPVETPEEVAQMLDDGVKRSRKQVQMFDPFADFAKIEQLKEDKKQQKIREEKEEKERLRMEKRMKKLLEKERRKKEKQEMRGSLFGKSNVPVARLKPETKFKLKKKVALPLPTSKRLPKEKVIVKEEKTSKELKINKPKKSGEKKRALRRLQNQDPTVERLKQAWDVPQRNRAVSASLRFGHQRFCKIRSEANLTSLPIQDIEVFFRSYFYQLSLQLAVAFLEMLNNDTSSFKEDNIKTFLCECLGNSGSKELDWLCDCVSNGMKFYLEIESQRRFFRLPVVLAETAFVSELRRGAALRALRRIFILNRIERIVEDSLDDILTELGYEQLGRRGCPTSILPSLDVDLKARLVSTEELLLSIGALVGNTALRSPVAWWDRSCDVALLVGTFVHGLGNYDAMMGDDGLPFAFKIKQFAKSDEACAAAQKSFMCAAKATTGVFRDALEAAKIKDQLQIQAAVAAAAATSSKREKDALALREGGEAADAVSTAVHDTPADKLYEIDGDDSHFITLPRLKQVLLGSVQTEQNGLVADMEIDRPVQTSSNDDALAMEEKSGRRKRSAPQALTMPDARILDHRLMYILSEVERHAYPEEASDMELDDPQPPTGLWPRSDTVSVNNIIKNRVKSLVFGASAEQGSHDFELMGIGIHGMQSGSSHRSLDDGSDYFVGSANLDLAQIAYGADAPRYLRAIGVPMNMTRFAVSALVHANGHCVERLLENEKKRNMIGDDKPTPLQVTKETAEKPEADPPKDEKGELAKTEPVTSELEKPSAEGDKTDDANEPEQLSVPTAPMSAKERNPLIPKAFEDNAKLRDCICAVVLYYGFPFKEGMDGQVSAQIWQHVRDQCVALGAVSPYSVFSAERFISLVQQLAEDPMEIPDFEIIKEYVLDCLLPHCLRLCLMGNGPVLENARGSKGQYETAFGISLYPEPTENLQCGLPDPSLPLEQHSVEALASAFAILRRAQLVRSIMEIATGKLPMENLDAVLRSSFMCKSMAGLPVWWCPWIHDAALLIEAATRGLFSIIQDRKSESRIPLAFSHDAIVQHMRSTFLSDGSVLPVTDEGSISDELDSWIRHHAQIFPSEAVLERRLAFLCAKATESLQEDNGRYDNLPMFDHGAWPRN